MVKILTDSTADLSPDRLREAGIRMVPLNVHFGTETFKDGVTLRPGDFYRMLGSRPEHPKTSQPSPADFLAAYRDLTADGSEVVSLHLSGKMSGTVESARLASRDPAAGRVHVMDTGLVTMALGLVVLEAARLAAAGKPAAEIRARVEALRSRMQVYFIVDTLEYLRRGGRIGRASALVGSLLNIKPVLTLTDGQVGPFEKVRGSAQALKRLAEVYADFAAQHRGKGIRLALCHAVNPGLLGQLCEKIYALHGVEGALEAEIGPVVGAHAGPGTLCLCFYAED